MNRQNILTWVVLLVFTVMAGFVSSESMRYTVPAILALAIIKFIGVSFGFMEMSKAHALWKTLILLFLAIFSGVIIIAY